MLTENKTIQRVSEGKENQVLYYVVSGGEGGLVILHRLEFLGEKPVNVDGNRLTCLRK